MPIRPRSLPLAGRCSTLATTLSGVALWAACPHAASKEATSLPSYPNTANRTPGTILLPPSAPMPSTPPPGASPNVRLATIPNRVVGGTSVSRGNRSPLPPTSSFRNRGQAHTSATVRAGRDRDGMQRRKRCPYKSLHVSSVPGTNGTTTPPAPARASLALQRYFLSSTLAIFGRMARRTGSAPRRMSLCIRRLGLTALEAPPFPPLCVIRPPIGLTHNGRFGDPDGSGAVFSILARRMSPYIVHPQGLTMRVRPEVAL